MVDYLLKKLGHKLLFRIIFMVIALFQVFYLVRAFQYSIPLGHDGVIYFWPIGKFMAQSSLKDFFIALVSSFLGEDHLSPIPYLYGFACNLLSSRPTWVINITVKLNYIIMVISSLVVVFYLWKDRLRLLIFFLLLTFNLSMTWHNMISPGSNLAIIPPLWCLFFLHRFIQNNNRFDLFLFSICFIILTFSFETAFVGIPLLAVYTLFLIWNKQAPRTDKIKDISKICLLMFFTFLPYMIIHYKLYGTPIPASRIALCVEGSRLIYYCKMLLPQMSEWFFGIGRVIFGKVAIGKISIVMFVIFPLVILFVYLVYKFKLLSKIGFYLFIAFLFQLLCILYAARVGPGMWTLAGIIFCMILADIISNTITTFSKNNDSTTILKNTYSFVFIAIPLLFLVNEVVQPFKRAEAMYERPYQSSQAAYKAINEGADRIVVVRLPEAERLMHPMAFWVGNKIYNKEAGLWLYPEYYTFLFKNMNIETYNNRDNRPFSYFRPFLIPKPGNDEVIVFKNRNLFSRLFLDGNDCKILRSGVIPYAPQDSFNLCFPHLSRYNRDASMLEFTLTFLGNPHDVDKILYGGKEINNWKVLDHKILFVTKDLSLKNDLVIESKSGQPRLELIEVSFPKDSPAILGESDSIPVNTISLATANAPCRFWISPPGKPEMSVVQDFVICGTLDAGKSISFNTLLTMPLELAYLSFETNRDKRTRGKISLRDFSNEDFPIYICCPDPSTKP